MLVTVSCSKPASKTLAQQETVQDQELRNDGPAVVLDKYRQLHEKKPESRESFYLYVRVIGDPVEQWKQIAKLTKQFPRFAPGYYLQVGILKRVGRYDLAVKSLEKAASLAPDSGGYQKELVKARHHFVGMSSYDFGKFISDLQRAMKAKKLRKVPGDDDVTLDLLEAVTLGKAKRIVKSGVEMIAVNTAATTNTITFYLKNTSNDDVVLEGSDNKSKTGVASCFSKQGRRFAPTKLTTGGRTDLCRACPGADIRVRSGASRRFQVTWKLTYKEMKNIDYCLFFNLPRKGDVVQVHRPYPY